MSREPKKKPKERGPEEALPSRRDVALAAQLRASDALHLAYVATLEPRERANLAPWAQ